MLIPTIIGIVTYVVLSCLDQKKNLAAFLSENRTNLLITASVCLLVGLFGKVAMVVLLTALLMPILASYSIPSIVGKLKGITNNLLQWIKGLSQ